MNDIWSILQLAQTKNVAEIKKAYAKMSQQYHPEEEPELFLQLRNAYKAALAYAADSRTPDTAHNFGQPDKNVEAEEAPTNVTQYAEHKEVKAQTNAAQDDKRKPQDEQTNTGDASGLSSQLKAWDFSLLDREADENLFIDCEANQKFLELYLGKQRKERARWTDYFTSPAFLTVCRKKGFTALLLSEITEHEQEYPLNREFLAGLYLAYLFTAKDAVYTDRTERHFNIASNAGFDGLDSVLQIAAKGPLPKRFDGNDLALSAGYTDYWYLVELAENGYWSDWKLSSLEKILERYVLAHIKDKCSGEYDRHPACLRLLEHFFASTELPEEAYRILWKRLDLKNARMGRTKLFYGRLREIALDHLPELDNEQEESFWQLHEAFAQYSSQSAKRAETDPEKDKEETDALFAREDFQRALRSRKMVELYVWNVWLSEQRCFYFLERILAFYQANPDAPFAAQVIGQTQEILHRKEAARQNAEDEAAATGRPSLTDRPFLRYWLNVSVPHARDPKTGVLLKKYLNTHFPYSSDWSKRFLGFDEESRQFAAPKSQLIVLDGIACELRFHLYYIEYLVDGEEVFRPFLTWEQLQTAGSVDDFFLLLPMTVTAYEAYPQVCEEINRRLADTAIPREELPVIGGSLAGNVCRLYSDDDMEEELSDDESDRDEFRNASDDLSDNIKGNKTDGFSDIPLEIYRESPEFLYGCEWWEPTKALFVFKQTETERSYLPHGRYDHIDNAMLAVTLAKRLLTDLLSPSGINPLLMEQLPEYVYATPQHAPVRCFTGDEITGESIRTLLEEFSKGDFVRLELSWDMQADPAEPMAYPPRRSLVFLEDKGLYACLYFDDNKAACYPLLSLPEVYRTVDHKDVVNAAFRQGILPNYCIHHDFVSIRKNLDDVFSQAGRPDGIAKKADGTMLWSTAVYGKRHKYNMLKQQLGAFSVERAHNSIVSKFTLSQYPVALESIDLEGVQTVLNISSVCKDEVQQELARFMQGSLQKLRLTWEIKDTNALEDNATYCAHLVLLQDEGRYMMAYLRDDKKRAEYYVADPRAYMDVEGKKYPKDTFLGRTTPAYLIHSDLTKIRNCMDLMFANIAAPSAVTGRFGDFAGENPVKPRSYEEIRASLVRE